MSVKLLHEPKTTDYCKQCGCSPEAAQHVFDHTYVPPEYLLWPMCKCCGKDAAYSEALFCGAACSVQHEREDCSCFKPLVIDPRKRRVQLQAKLDAEFGAGKVSVSVELPMHDSICIDCPPELAERVAEIVDSMLETNALSVLRGGS